MTALTLHTEKAAQLDITAIRRHAVALRNTTWHVHRALDVHGAAPPSMSCSAHLQRYALPGRSSDVKDIVISWQCDSWLGIYFCGQKYPQIASHNGTAKQVLASGFCLQAQMCILRCRGKGTEDIKCSAVGNLKHQDRHYPFNAL